MKSDDHQAFTLVELLVVIVVIAVMSVLLMPLLGKTQKKAQGAADLSNLRQIGMGFLAFEGENGRFPYAQEANGFYWDQALVTNKYLPDPSVFASPADKVARTSPNARKRSYSINSMVASVLDADGNTTGTVNPGVTANIARYGIGGYWLRSDRGRSKVVVLHLRPTPANCYGTAGSLINDQPALSAFLSTPNPTVYLPLADPPGNLAASYLFGDGHVEVIDLKKVAAGSVTQQEGWMQVNYFRAKN
jgi:prepilin-type N-terminal cleavage/methylation domain-containing protein/prepilin-type processing-associated H-X9-DG protein